MENKELQQLLENQKYSFKPYFSDRVMAGLEAMPGKLENSFEKALDFLFPKLSFGSMAVVALLLAGTYISTGNLDLDSITGVYSLENQWYETDYFDLF